ncbi:hypothetical protein B4W72_10190 [Staphylococcus delphini]|nr:hypothetical protein B4W72_10190 [Staphylococcus delphini]
MDFPDQLIPQESQPSGQSYIKNSNIGQVYEFNKTIVSIFCPIDPHFLTVLKSLMNYKGMNELRPGKHNVPAPFLYWECLKVRIREE